MPIVISTLFCVNKCMCNGRSQIREVGPHFCKFHESTWPWEHVARASSRALECTCASENFWSKPPRGVSGAMDNASNYRAEASEASLLSFTVNPASSDIHSVLGNVLPLKKWCPCRCKTILLSHQHESVGTVE